MDSKECAREVQRRRALWEAGPEAVHVTLWQRGCPHFAFILRLSVGLNLKAID